MSVTYGEKTANYPRMKTDISFVDYCNTYEYQGFIADVFNFIEEWQLKDSKLWKRFAGQFREADADYDAGWRGEYWGKMMRGACFVYSYTRNPELYRILKNTVRDMMESSRENGRISTYAVGHEFSGWDMWCRKYVLLGMQYFMEICDEGDFKQQIVQSMSCQADYIMSKVGRQAEHKIPITETSYSWRGLNSSSILEPIVRLYSLTNERRYLDFAAYIVECGGMDVQNIFELAYEDKLYPYQYAATKAYEMISCFEGLLEYYRVTANEKHLQAVIHFADKVLESDFTVIGSSGCTHELFDHSTVRQANTTNGKIMQETCVTVTLMKFMYQLHLITGDPKYLDAFEISLYNGYLGSVNTGHVVNPVIAENYPECIAEALPFDSYSPLTAGIRGSGVGGLKVMSDYHHYGCCACIGAAGIGLVPKVQLMTIRDGFEMNLFINGKAASSTPADHPVCFETQTAYPADGKVLIAVRVQKKERFVLKIRNPGWNKQMSVFLNGVPVNSQEGYLILNREWSDGDTIELKMDMRTEAIRPIPYGHQVLMNSVIWGKNYVVPTYDQEDPLAHRHIALRRGPVMLAQDSRLGYEPDTPIDVAVDSDGYVAVQIPKMKTAPYDCIVEAQVPLTDQTRMTVTDYASAGKLWTEESKMAVWMLTK